MDNLGFNYKESYTLENGNGHLEKNGDFQPKLILNGDFKAQTEKCDTIEKKVDHGGAADLLYGLDDNPPWYICLFIGFQHYLEMIGATIACPFFLTPALCMLEEDENKANIISTLVFMSGLITLLQSCMGTRLPIVQGGSFSYLIPTLSIMSLPKWKCPERDVLIAMSEEDRTECWQVRMREIQGAIIFAALFETFLGFFGIIGMILKYITPLTVAPAITLIGISLFKDAAKECAKNWYVSMGTMLLLIIFSQHLRKIEFAMPACFSKKNDDSETESSNSKLETKAPIKFPIFQVFPVLLTLLIINIIVAILTYTDIIPEGDQARMDTKARLLTNAPWFRVPYPFQWGWPTVSIGAILGVVSGVMASMVESIGDYYACARICDVGVPPRHAMNRGIFVEGFGCFLSGIFGSGNGSTSYSNNIGTISITRVASRRVIVIAGIIMVILSLIGKAGAIFVSIPDPIIGGMFCYIFPLVMAVGIHILQDVDLNSTRNIFIASFAIFFGLLISEYIKATPDLIQTGNEILDSILQILLGTGMFIAGFIGFILDNTVPGTREERGLGHFEEPDENDVDKTYIYPYGMNILKKIKFLKYLPISPTYENEGILSKLPCFKNEDY